MLVFVKSNIVQQFSADRIYHKFENCVILKFKTDRVLKSDIFIMNFAYVSPEGSSIYDDATGYNGICINEDNCIDIISKHPDSNLLLASDLNARCGDLQDISSNDDLDFILN